MVAQPCTANALLLIRPEPENHLGLVVCLGVHVAPADRVGVGHQLVMEIAMNVVAVLSACPNTVVLLCGDHRQRGELVGGRVVGWMGG